MRRRHGFTLVEMMVAVALVLFIMVILTQAFTAGLTSFRQLKATGDLEAKLRNTATILRKDLNADHFEGRRRLSDRYMLRQGGTNDTLYRNEGRPREGFFSIFQAAHSRAWGGSPPDPFNEGVDADGLLSIRQTGHSLYFTTKLRGNSREDFWSANVPAASLLFTRRTTFFDQPADARYQEAPGNYKSQWAEVAYFLTQYDRPGEPTAGGTPLFALWRSQFVVVADNTELNWPPAATPQRIPAGQLDQHYAMSCHPERPSGVNLYFSSPSDLAEDLNKRAYNTRGAFIRDTPEKHAAVPLLNDVISFDVQILRNTINLQTGVVTTDANFRYISSALPPANTATIGVGYFDTADLPDNWWIIALKITVRVWDAKTQQTRQITIVQDM